MRSFLAAAFLALIAACTALSTTRHGKASLSIFSRRRADARAAAPLLSFRGGSDEDAEDAVDAEDAEDAEAPAPVDVRRVALPGPLAQMMHELLQPHNLPEFLRRHDALTALAQRGRGGGGR